MSDVGGWLFSAGGWVAATGSSARRPQWGQAETGVSAGRVAVVKGRRWRRMKE